MLEKVSGVRRKDQGFRALRGFPEGHDPEKAIGHPKRWPGSFPIKSGTLLSQGKVLKMQRRAAEESLTDHGKDNSNGHAHVGDAIRHKPGILGFLRQIGFMGATTISITNFRQSSQAVRKP